MDPTHLTLVLFAVVTTAVLSGYYVFTNESSVSRRLGTLTADSPARTSQPVRSTKPSRFSSSFSKSIRMPAAGIRTSVTFWWPPASSIRPPRHTNAPSN